MTSLDRDTRAIQTSAAPSSMARVWGGAAFPVHPPLTHFAILMAAGVGGGRPVFGYGIRVKRQADQGR
jgi:hypothetical protein